MRAMKQGWIVCAVLLAASVVAQARGIKICFEAESATAVEAPMVVVSNGVEGASGAYLEIPEGAGNPPKVEAGKAVFTVDVPEDGAFTLWCRVWWEDECGNSFTVKIDDQPAFLFGEDATYKTWHWVRSPPRLVPLQLAAGPATLTLHNREDGVRIDQILLTTDRRRVPVGIEEP